jgi:hypothetical protein
MTMPATILKGLLALYAAYALLKFFDFFFVSRERRMASIERGYQDDGRAIRVFDAVMLGLVMILVVLQVLAGVQGLSFLTGLLVGMTLIQVYFHRFNRQLPGNEAPPEPVSAIKLMSWSIQANPELAWREIVMMTVLLVGALVLVFAPQVAAWLPRSR